MNFEKYRNDGWGLSVEGFQDLYQLIAAMDKEEINVLEFGSGTSTMFLVDVAKSGIKKINIESYDNSELWCFKPDQDYDFLDLKIRPLVECSGQSFAKMFLNRKYDPELMSRRTTAPSTRQKNCFYEILNEDMKSNSYDLVIVDGPNGNGRSIGFLHLFEVITNNCYIYIDDFNHYPFEKHLKYLFETELCSKRVSTPSEQRDAYVIYKILSKKERSKS